MNAKHIVLIIIKHLFFSLIRGSVYIIVLPATLPITDKTSNYKLGIIINTINS